MLIDRMNIGIDLMGGDFASAEVFKGIRKYFTDNADTTVHITLFGDITYKDSFLHTIPNHADKVHFVSTSQVIGMNEHPTKAFKEKTDSSIAVGFKHLATGLTDAFISAGNSGAMMVGALFNVKLIEGIIRPAISSVLPKQSGGTGLLIDVGLNADCKPELLNQFAILASVYAKYVLEINQPKVGLLNVGEEEGKGNLLTQATYPLLKANEHIHFIGNIEGRDAFTEKADILVCDGFTGNIILKMAESIFDVSQKENIDNAYFSRFNFEIYGGTPVLGIEKPVIIGHGISGETAFANMISVAQKMLETDVLGKLKNEITGQ